MWDLCLDTRTFLQSGFEHHPKYFPIAGNICIVNYGTYNFATLWLFCSNFNHLYVVHDVTGTGLTVITTLKKFCSFLLVSEDNEENI